MEWMYLTPGDSACGTADLGYYVGDKYQMADNIVDKLESIISKLCEDDSTTRSYRRALVFSHIIQKDLVPILLEAKDNLQIFNAVVRLLVHFTTPIECLFSPVDLSESEDEQQAVFELQQHLSEAKNIFLDPRVTRCILEYLEKVANKENKDSDPEILQGAKSCLTLIRNILHIPTDNPSGGSSPSSSSSVNQKQSSRQNQILWNLFSHNFDSIIISLIGHQFLSEWCTSLMQLIALIYKDQHVHNLQRLLHLWLETSISESSEDNESNTSPQPQGCSSPVLTSTDPTDDSSDSNGGNGNGNGNNQEKEGMCQADQSSDSGNETKTDEDKAKKTTTVEGPRGEKSKTEVKDVEMSYESSDSCGKEPPLKKSAMVKSPSKESSEIVVVKVTKSDEDYLLHHKQTNRINPVVTTVTTSVTQQGEKHKKSTTPSSFKPIASTKESVATSETKQPAGNEAIRHSDPAGSDYGYASQPTMGTDNQENISTSSNDEDKEHEVQPHTNLQKPRPKKRMITAAEKRELRRKKLIRRSKSNRMKVRALVHHIPTDEDISDLLTEFTVDFLLKGYSSLVYDIKKKLLYDADLHVDKSHFLWLITYFLKFASQLEVELEQIGPVLSIDILAYLTYEGVRLFEELELACRQRTVDLKPPLRRMHLVVTAIHEFIKTLGIYEKFTHFSKENQLKLHEIQVAAWSIKELRQLFLLLIRRFNPAMQSRQYLCDVILGNHTLLVMIENIIGEEPNSNEKMSKHLSQFATVDVMRHYGYALENVQSNCEPVNDAIFTMMHHVSGDLNCPEALFIPSVLKTFSYIWEQELEICDDWADLIEYVIQKFIHTMGHKPHACASNLLECLDSSEAIDENGFTRAQLDNLYWHYTQSRTAEDIVGEIIEMYKKTDTVTKTRLSVIQALLSQGIITHAQYMSLMYMKSVLFPCKTDHEGSVIAEVGSEHCDSEGHDTDIENNDTPNSQTASDQIQVLKDLLKKQGKACLLTWLQQILLDACMVKLNNGKMFTEDSEVLEPVPYHFNFLNQSIPVVPWNKHQELGLQTETFILLLHKLGFHLAADVGKCFPRIPHFWSADHIIHLVQKLGPIRVGELNFNPEMIQSLIDKMADESLSSEESEKNDMEGGWIDHKFEKEDNLELFATPTPTSSWLQMALVSKRALLPRADRKQVTCTTSSTYLVSCTGRQSEQQQPSPSSESVKSTCSSLDLMVSPQSMESSPVGTPDDNSSTFEKMQI